MEKVAVFIDGFNLYFGLNSKCPTLKWLDVYLLSENLLKPNQTLVAVNYFTARIGNNPSKEQRQSIYLSAIKNTQASIIYGHYKSKPKSCKRCGHTWTTNEEKMTDVNIAMEMVKGAYKDIYDVAILISGDSDLIPPIKSVQQLFSKKVFVVFPPNRHNNSVKNAADFSMNLGRGKISQSQFPLKITLQNGHNIKKPSVW
ncbi:NYN domain-containing protein [Aureivirga marina]|uniref:NYN domain-containing protein n=1 Tax=Aureivirga marina TaxID=1182451 RepID=UPI0018C9C085|nr:NYN domain-containing protein [Aureivirga marina]